MRDTNNDIRTTQYEIAERSEAYLEEPMQTLEKKLKNRKARIAVIGLGYVGSVTAAGLAQDNKVIGIDIDKENDRVV